MNTRSLIVASTTAGMLLLVASPAPAQQAEVSKPPNPPKSSSGTSGILTVDPVAALSSSVGFVEVTGTLSCDEGSTATIIVDIRQRAKGQDVGTVGFQDFLCPVGSWSMLLRSDAGEVFGGPDFKPGRADVVAGAFICEAESCIEEMVQLQIRVVPR